MSDHQKTLANGAELTTETWSDFVARLRYHCIGDGVRAHITAEPLFIVQSKNGSRWEYVSSHFTKEAAEDFIARNAHNYRKGIRVYVNAQVRCHEFNAIKRAILDGRLVLKEASDA